MYLYSYMYMYIYMYIYVHIDIHTYMHTQCNTLLYRCIAHNVLERFIGKCFEAVPQDRDRVFMPPFVGQHYCHFRMQFSPICVSVCVCVKDKQWRRERGEHGSENE